MFTAADKLDNVFQLCAFQCVNVLMQKHVFTFTIGHMVLDLGLFLEIMQYIYEYSE